MADYTANIATATRLIANKGMEVTFKHVIEGEERDPTTGAFITTTESYFVQALKTNPSAEELTAGYPSGSIIILVSGSEFPFEPTTKDLFEFEHKEWDIKQIIKVAPAEQVILYKFILLEKGNID